MRLFGASGQPLSTYNQPNVVALQAGETYYFNSNINPSQPGQGTGNAGWFEAKLGRYTALQALDPVSQIWRGVGDDGNAQRRSYTDGANYRLANQSGCAVGAAVTTAGSAYTAPPTVVASAGGSKWVAVLGPLVSAITVGYGGTTYTYPPFVWIAPPPAGGVQATATAVLTAAAVSSIVVTDEGAGYSSGTPAVLLINDPRDTTGTGATASATLSGSGTVAAVLCIDHGNPITSGTVPTLTFGSGSAAATVLMNWGITTYAVSTAGAGYTSSGAFADLSAIGPGTVASPSYTNPSIQDGLVRVRKADIWIPTNASGGLTIGATAVINDGGVYRGIPTPVITAAQPPSTTGVVTLTMGGFSDVSFLTPA